MDSYKQVKGKKRFTAKHYLAFILPSLIGILLFMTPLVINEEITIPVAFLAGILEEALIDVLPLWMTILLILSVIMTVIVVAIKPAFVKKSQMAQALFDVGWTWTIIRAVGVLFAVLTLMEWGPEFIWSEDTGGLLLFELIPILFSVFLFAGFFLPLLMNFGLMELVGSVLNRIMRPLFTLPGRSSIDCMASWMGDGTIGVLLTNKQYEDGYYTKREAAVIGTTFSVVSITFSIVILTYMSLEHLFLQYYGTIVLAGFVAAVICPRIPPLSRKADTYITEKKFDATEEKQSFIASFKSGLEQALTRATTNNGVAKNVSGGLKNVLDMWLGVIPVVMALGTIALVVAEYTPIFQWLGAPFIPLLQLMQVPEATEAAQTMVIGFADMFLPAIIGSGIESEMTRFIIACVSVTQLIYMSEIGGLLLASKLPVKFFDLVIIFIERTLITLPVVVLMAHLIF
ncbi:YjiH family protein [Alkalihalophilus lindianensis]|uniref:YjiH family protein n=1 Tax=Alkalihalophilus lindianensis TaxID=1630542 RepID=A0ABU3X9N4_9BACI|nr:YjiH family protein [Alkalihalophilus lindianensis]MDV2684606.1 YjiH family protein [Alkalihalophilus lindianensis]